MDGNIDIMEVISFRKRSKDIRQVDFFDSRQDIANAFQDSILTLFHITKPGNNSQKELSAMNTNN